MNEFEDIRMIGDAANGLKAIEPVDQLNQDLVLIDLAMPIEANNLKTFRIDLDESNCEIIMNFDQ